MDWITTRYFAYLLLFAVQQHFNSIVVVNFAVLGIAIISSLLLHLLSFVVVSSSFILEAKFNCEQGDSFQFNFTVS